MTRGRLASGYRLDEVPGWPPSLKLFATAVSLLFLSQVLLYPPGSDVSPYAFFTRALHPNEVAGITVQTWAVLFLAAICLTASFGSASRYVQGKAFVWFAIYSIALVSLVTAKSVADFIDGVGKLALPMLVYLFLAPRTTGSLRHVAAKVVLCVNVFTVGQVFFSKLTTGGFAANTYYYEMAEEYFGFYYHPFAFAGVLGICSMVALYNVVNRSRAALNAVLIALNLWLIFETQVRTFMLATAGSLAIAFVLLMIRRKKPLELVITITVSAIGAIALRGTDFASERVTADSSSGRLDRWAQDLDVFFGTAHPLQLIIGGGPGHIQRINESISGVAINSLNIFIDLLVDFGFLGLLLFALAWITIARDATRLGDGWFVISLCSFVGSSSILTNLFNFPAVAVLFAIALTAPRMSKGDTRIEGLGTSFATVPRSRREQPVVGRRIY